MTEQEIKTPEGFDIRYTEFSDAPFLQKWLADPSVSEWFPMADPVEIEDGVNRWIGFARYRCSLTATINGTPVGIATLYLQPYRKLAHQCEMGIIVSQDHRNQGVGSNLMKNIIHLAKTMFNIEVLHLQVYSDNPAVHLYTRFGFKEFGMQQKWIKDFDGRFIRRVFMEKELS